MTADEPSPRLYELRIVREPRPGYGRLVSVASAADVFHAFRAQLEPSDREQCLALLLDARNRVLGFHVVSVGSLTSTLVHPREVFKAAMLSNAAAIILIHNHPSGDPEPSAEDLALTRRLRSVGDLVGIPVIDHVVVGDGRYVSLAERGQLDR